MANTSRMNRLEELGRVDAEKAFTKKGKRNLKDEKKRIVKGLKSGGAATRGFGIAKMNRGGETKRKSSSSKKSRGTGAAIKGTKFKGVF